ncbi:MAG: glycosyltransferase family 2 protein [Bacteroidota bacterium]
MNPLVSIIIPTFNRAHLIGETLDSISAQSYQIWECLVVDDGSSDYTNELINFYCEKDSRFSYYKRPINRKKGANTCRNYGLELSKGHFINWFDDDDLMHPKKLEFQIASLEDSNYNFSICQTLIFENNLSNILGLRHEKIYSNNPFEDYLMEKIGWLTQAPLWKKDFLIQNSFKFDEELQAAQEWEFHCRVLFYCNGYDRIEQPLVYIRQHLESVSYNKEVELRRLHYYKAREKIFLLIKNREISGRLKRYRNNYFLNHYRKFIFRRNFDSAFKCLLNHIIPNKEIQLKYKFKMVIVFFSFTIFNKGEILFKGNPYKIS